MSHYPQAAFIKSADAPAQFVPDDGAEVAFAGRSNAGKSSAINVLVNRRQFARTSKTPGRTQLVNFFSLRETERLVDLLSAEPIAGITLDITRAIQREIPAARAIAADFNPEPPPARKQGLLARLGQRVRLRGITSGD